uniref:U2A'/phosphoprotein 32 family A C-terminal domain-containing protein n=1 Tax=Leersia perrieri TaxID=77586 RepID=A0A0D9X1B9_9ORYZ
MDEAWERAVEAALQAAGEGSSSPARSLTLDGAVKCLHGRLPAAEILERYQSLEHLSIAGVGVASLAGFPRLRNLTRLTLSDNRIAGGLDHLVAAGLASLRDLDLSNNRIQDVGDLAPLANLRLVSLDLYECPVTRVKDYRSKVFAMIRTLKYLDKMDADENERPESDDDDDDGDGDGDGEEDDDDDDDEDEDPGSGEVANGGVAHARGGVAGHPVEVNGVIDVDEDESDADEVVPNGGAEHHHANGFRVAAVGGGPDEDEYVEEEDDDDEEDYEEEDDLGEEIDEDGDDDDAVVEVHQVHDVPSSSDEEEDGIEEDDDEEDEDEEEVEDDGEEAEPESSGRVPLAVGDVGEEIDGHEHGEGDDEDENGEIGEEDEERLEDDRVYEGNDDDDDEEDVDDEPSTCGPISPTQKLSAPTAILIGRPKDNEPNGWLGGDRAAPAAIATELQFSHLQSADRVVAGNQCHPTEPVDGKQASPRRPSPAKNEVLHGHLIGVIAD